jgi:hypothetical protein
MRRKNLILSLVCTVLLPILECKAADKGMQDEVQSQPERVSTEAGARASETVLAVPADVKWAHHLGMGFAAFGMIAGVAQLLYIGKYCVEMIADRTKKDQWYSERGIVFKEVKQEKAGFEEPLNSPFSSYYLNLQPTLPEIQSVLYSALYKASIVATEGPSEISQAIVTALAQSKIPLMSCKYFESYLPSQTHHQGIAVYFEKNGMMMERLWLIINERQWILNKKRLMKYGCLSGIMTSVFAAAGIAIKAYRLPVVKPEAATLETTVKKFAEAAFVGPFGLITLIRGIRGISDPTMPKGFALQLVALGGMLLCEQYKSLRLLFLNDKAAQPYEIFDSLFSRLLDSLFLRLYCILESLKEKLEDNMISEMRNPAQASSNSHINSDHPST